MASSSKSKRPRSSVNPSNAHLQFLNSPDNAKFFERISSYPILQDRFVKFQDFSDYELSNLIESTGLFSLFSKDNSVPCYPFLVKLFYTNMTFSTPPSPRAIETSVKNIPIKFNPTLLGNMLSIPSTGTSLSHITMDNPGVIENIIIPGRKFKPGMSANSLQPLPRIIARIFSYNIIPKTG
jgi:hypothetical protein